MPKTKKKKKTAPKKKATKKTATKKGAAKKYQKVLPTRKEVIKRHKQFKKELGSKLIPATKVKAYCKHLGLRADNKLIEGITDELYAILKKGALRTVKNGRKTVRPWDF